MSGVAENRDALLVRARELLQADGVALGNAQVALLDRHVALVREWNAIVGVVSTAEVGSLWDRHVVDSLSVAGVLASLGISGGYLVDIGSGGGFPAIPVKIVLPELTVILVERSEKKLGFLRKVVGALGLTGVDFQRGEFSAGMLKRGADAITARAVERPEKLVGVIGRAMGRGTVFLSQSGVAFGEGFVVERVEDGWTRAGLRRGSLDIVRRAG